MASFVRFVCLLVFANLAWAGGLWIEFGNPHAVHDPAAQGAVATVRLFRMGGVVIRDPTIRGEAEGLIGTERQSQPLTLVKLNSPGLFAVHWKRPADGVWVLTFTIGQGLDGCVDAFFEVQGDSLGLHTTLLYRYIRAEEIGRVLVAMRDRSTTSAQLRQ